MVDANEGAPIDATIAIPLQFRSGLLETRKTTYIDGWLGVRDAHARW